MATDFSNLKRPIYEMPDFVEKALKKRGLMSAYLERPAYQQNDYVGWIIRATRWETKDKRLNQMLDELERGSVYMIGMSAGRLPKTSRNVNSGPCADA